MELRRTTIGSSPRELPPTGADPRFYPTPESPAWLAAMNDADEAAERWLEEQEGR